MDLVAQFPLLSTLVEQRAGGQRRLPIGPPAGGRAAAATDGEKSGGDPTSAPGEDQDQPRSAPDGSRTPPGGASPPASPPEPPTAVHLPGPPRERRPGHYGLGIQFDQKADDPELGRLVESTIWVNEAHPAYRRAAASRAEGYHIALAAAMALAPLAVEPPGQHAFVTAFLASWGAAIDRRRPRRRR